jgi:glycosyltransferase involved in cell wall biosynthesis
MNQYKSSDIRQNHAAWITWEVQVRNRSMSSLLKVPVYELIVNKHRVIRYPILIFKTLKLIYKKDIRILFVQNPSIVLSMLAVLLKFIRNIRVIVDAHNSGIYPLEGKSKFLSWIARFIARKADAVIVSNNYLAETVQAWKAKPIVMPDPIPRLTVVKKITFERPYVFFICTWASDEPYLEIIKAASLVPHDVDIYITGNYRNKLTPEQIENLPSNIKLLGFVSEEDYVAYFKSCLLAIDLTTRENCLVCGAYEALSLAKPCIVSDSQVNREIFGSGFIYTRNTAMSIADAINSGISTLEKLNLDIIEQAQAHNVLIEQRISELKRILKE